MESHFDVRRSVDVFASPFGAHQIRPADKDASVDGRVFDGEAPEVIGLIVIKLRPGGIRGSLLDDFPLNHRIFIDVIPGGRSDADGEGVRLGVGLQDCVLVAIDRGRNRNSIWQFITIIDWR